MLRDRIAPRTSLVVDQTGYNPTLFAHLLGALAELPHRPKRIVVPINLRVFSAQWAAHHEYQFAEEHKCLETFIATGELVPMAERPAVHPSVWEAYDDTPATPGRTVGSYTMAVGCRPRSSAQIFWRKKEIFEFHYGYAWDSVHPHIVALKEIQLNWPEARFYITPINVEGADRFCPGLSRKINVNGCAVGNVLGVSTDTLMSYGSQYFVKPDETTEHLNEHGRAALAQHVLGRILEGLT
jgi:hypothetical protein